jgi:hypothetical protein
MNIEDRHSELRRRALHALGLTLLAAPIPTVLLIILTEFLGASWLDSMVASCIACEPLNRAIDSLKVGASCLGRTRWPAYLYSIT